MNQTGVRSTGSRRAARTRRGSRTRPRLALRMQSLGEHPVPSGPLAARWLEWEVPPIQAGVLVQLRIVVQNVGLAAWQENVNLAYHWLDERGNPIVWDGLRTPVEAKPNAVLQGAARPRGRVPP